MKKLIKYSLIIIIISIPAWLIVDDIIVKSVIIKTSEKLLKRKTYLKSVNVSYFPSLELSLTEFKLPNPLAENYLINSDKLSIKLNVLGLLRKSLIVDEIMSKNTIMFDKSIPITIIETNEKSNDTDKKDNTSLKQLISSGVSSSFSLFNDADIKSNVEQSFDFSAETTKIDEIITSSTALINERKNKILESTTKTLYNLNSINVKNISNIEQLNETVKSVENATSSYNKMSSQIQGVESIYKSSRREINQINDEISQKLTSSLTFDVLNQQLLPSNSTLNEPLKKVVSFFINKFKSKAKSQDEQREVQKFQGVTYQFNQKDHPSFLIKRIDLNSKGNQYELKGSNITMSNQVDDQMNINISLKNMSNYELLMLNLNSVDKKTFNIDVKIDKIKINQTRLYENDNVIVNFLENKSTYLIFSGELSNTSNLVMNVEINQPLYRVINKKSTKSLIGDFIPYLNNQDLKLQVLVDGTLDDFNLNATSNLDPLIKNIQALLLPKKLNQLKNEAKRIKNIELQKTNGKISDFSNSYLKIVNQLKFQEEEILKQTKKIENEINQKRGNLSKAVENELKKQIKTLSF